MAAIDIITRYFPQLTPEQIEHFTQLDALYRDWNAKIKRHLSQGYRCAL